MFERRSLKWPITLGVVLFVSLVALIVGWALITVYGALANEEAARLYWTLLTVGSLLIVLVIVGVALYLALSVKAINLSQRQSNFLDSVTHELKSPIASLKLYLQTLNRRAVTPEEQLKFCRYMLEDVERLDRLINHLLVTARLHRETVDEEREDVEIAPLIGQCANAIRERYDSAPDAICLRIEPSVIRARRADLDMIFGNLIDNAFKYAGEPPHIEIVSKPRPDGRVVTLISDNGRGIPLRSRREIFGRFIRLGSELEREKPGTGLGLYIVETLVRRLRGTVRVVDPIDGKGAVFEVVLPGWTRESPVERPRPAESLTAGD